MHVDPAEVIAELTRTDVLHLKSARTSEDLGQVTCAICLQELQAAATTDESRTSDVPLASSSADDKTLVVLPCSR